jgi:hypothetical protein
MPSHFPIGHETREVCALEVLGHNYGTVTKKLVSQEQQRAIKGERAAENHRALYVEEVREQPRVVVTPDANSSTPGRW